MANIVLASNDSLCQSLATWLITNRKFQSGLPIDAISDEGELYYVRLITHNYQ